MMKTVVIIIFLQYQILEECTLRQLIKVKSIS